MPLTDKDLDGIEAYYLPIEENAQPGHEAGFRAAQILLQVEILRALRGEPEEKPKKVELAPAPMKKVEPPPAPMKKVEPTPAPKLEKKK